MEVGKRKQARTENEVKTRGALEPAWSSSPTRNPRYVLYCTNHENERQYVVNSYGLYAARKVFDALVGENEIEPSPLDPDRTMTFGDIDIKSDQMDAILAHVYTPEEEAWELPAPYPADIEAFLTGRRMSKRVDGESLTEKGERIYKKVVKEVKERVDRTGKITVQQLADEEGIDPRDARAALRKAGTVKPDGGWLGDEAWAKGIRTILQAAKKALEKKGKK
jgi:hypothetical protein